jgi:hypothetical protein
MAIPTNLLPINNPFREDIVDEVVTVTIPSGSSLGVPSNLLPINTADISGSFQSLAGVIPSGSIPEIPQFTVLNAVIPDSLFTTGSLDQVKARTIGAARKYISGLPLPRNIPTVPTITIPFPPRRPSYGQIKNYIKTKIDRIKQQRQKASVKALDTELKKQENPFKYRQSLKNQETRNTVLGRFNNQ